MKECAGPRCVRGKNVLENSYSRNCQITSSKVKARTLAVGIPGKFLSTGFASLICAISSRNLAMRQRVSELGWNDVCCTRC